MAAHQTTTPTTDEACPPWCDSTQCGVSDDSTGDGLHHSAPVVIDRPYEPTLTLWVAQDGYELPADATVFVQLRFRGDDDQVIGHTIELPDARRLADALADLVALAS